MPPTQRYLRALGIGFVSGLRSMTGPAAARLLRSSGSARFAVPAMAVGELIVDKLPAVPARTMPASLAFRALAGGFAARELAGKDADGRIAFVLGAAGAAAGSFAGIRLRREAVRLTGLPDPVVALVEDALAVGAALALSA